MLESLGAMLYHNRRDFIMSIILMIIGIAIFYPMMMRWRTMGDYTTHNALALDVVNNTGEFFRTTPHFLYHTTTALIFVLIPDMDIATAGAWVMILSYLALMLITYWQIRRISDLPATIPILLTSAIFVISLMILAPINIFTPENLYFGYFAPHVYHNPTVNIMKPFSVLLFFMSLQLFRQKEALLWRWVFPFALLTFLSLVAKPSFIIAFVPTLGLITAAFILWRIAQGLRKRLSLMSIFANILQRQYINWTVLMLGIVIPTFAILFYQTLTWTSSGGVGIDPFRVFFEWTLHYEENADKQILFKFIMSSAFPIAVYSLHLKKAYRNLMFNLAWLMFLVSVAYAYLLVDYTVIAAGDFTWSAQIAALILYIVATLFLFKQYAQVFVGEKFKPLQWAILILCLAIFSLHVVSGIHWYRLHLTQVMQDLLYIWW
jgi:hypothetical protein